MRPRTGLARALLDGLDWRAALRMPRTWGIVARHMIPVVGVVSLGWSGIQGISLVALDTVAALWCLVAVGSMLAARESWSAKGAGLAQTILGGLLVFAIVAGLLTFAVGVVAFVLGGEILQRGSFDAHDLVEGGWIFWAFGGLLLMQVPTFVGLSAEITEKTAKSLLEPRVGFLLRRLILAGLACSFLSFLWGSHAILGALIVTQLVLAAHEVFGEKLHEILFPKLAPTPAPAPRKARSRRSKR